MAADCSNLPLIIIFVLSDSPVYKLPSDNNGVSVTDYTYTAMLAQEAINFL